MSCSGLYDMIRKNWFIFEFCLALGTELVDRLDLVLCVCSLGMSGCVSPDVRNGSRAFGTVWWYGMVVWFWLSSRFRHLVSCF